MGVVRGDTELAARSGGARTLKRLGSYLSCYRWRFVATLLCLAVVATLDLAGPYLNKVAIDRYLKPSASAAQTWLDGMLPPLPAVSRGLGIIALLYVSVLLCKFVLEYVQSLLMQHTGQHVLFDIRESIFEHLSRLPMAYFDRTPVGVVMARVTTDVDTLNELFVAGVITMVGDLLAMLAIALAMLNLDWRLALATFSVVPLIATAANVFRRRSWQSLRRTRSAISSLSAFLQERLSSVKLVQVFGREKSESAAFCARNREYLEASLQALRAFMLLFPALEFFGSLALAIVICYGGERILHGHLSIGALVAFVLYCGRFYRPLANINEKFSSLQAALACGERIFDLLDEPVTLPAAEPTEPLGEMERIEFRNVWFAYRRRDDQPAEWEWVLRGVSFTLCRGQCVAVVGHTGAGKTTLINLLLRYYDPQEGSILVNGIDVRSLDASDLRRHLAVVSQDPFLFSGSIAGNIGFDSPHLPGEQVERAARAVGAHTFIEALDRGYQERLHERGATLSAGQRQLISFARALAHDPDVLVLDEATSSVDSRSEQILQDGMRRLQEGRSSLVVAHRLSTIRRADRILVMHRGRLVAEGTHAQLLAAGGIYARLYELQYRSQELTAASE